MDEVEFIKQCSNKKFIWNKRTLITALVSCLSSVQSANILNPLLDDWVVRQAVLYKVKRDLETEGCKTYHNMLIDNLITDFSSLNWQKKQTCSHILGFLYDSVSSNSQKKIIGFLLDSNSITIRNVGYKILRKDWNEQYKTTVLQNWDAYHDYYCAYLMASQFSVDLLIEHFTELQQVLIGKTGYIGLCIRVCKQNKKLLYEIETKDGITFTYLMYKLNKTISENQALSIFRKYKYDERIGLFLWCLGRMKLRSVLTSIVKDSSKLDKGQSVHNQKEVDKFGQMIQSRYPK